MIVQYAVTYELELWLSSDLSYLLAQEWGEYPGTMQDLSEKDGIVSGQSEFTSILLTPTGNATKQSSADSCSRPRLLSPLPQPDPFFPLPNPWSTQWLEPSNMLSGLLPTEYSSLPETFCLSYQSCCSRLPSKRTNKVTSPTSCIPRCVSSVLPSAHMLEPLAFSKLVSHVCVEPGASAKTSFVSIAQILRKSAGLEKPPDKRSFISLPLCHWHLLSQPMKSIQGH